MESNDEARFVRDDIDAATDLDGYRVDPSAVTHRIPAHPTLDGFEVMSYEFNADPFDTMTWLRANAPVYWDDAFGIWVVSRHEDIQMMERNHEIFCSGQGTRPTGRVPSMIDSDPPEHTRRRRIVSGGFTPRRVTAHEQFLRRIVGELIDKVIDDGGCDFVTDIASSIPLLMIAELMGLPAADEEKLIHWSDLFATGGSEIRDEVYVAVVEWAEYIVAQMEQRTDPEATDLISLLMYADGEPYSTEDLIYETMLILVGGDETTRHVMSGGLQALLRHPEQWAALKNDPDDLMNGAVEESLRWVTPVRNMNRTATRDVDLGGQNILEGDRLLMLYLSANRDERVFERSHEFDMYRSPNPHVAFGYGQHFCLGAQLARLELRVLFAEVIRRLPDIRLVHPDVEQPERRGNFVLGMEHLPVEW